MKREQKVQKVAEIRGVLEQADLLVLTEFSGLKVEDMTDLRAKLKEAEGQYQVIKNTLLRLASKDLSAEKLVDDFVGPNGMATASGDVVATAKVLHDFAKGNKNLKIKIGLLEGNVITAEELKALASLPSREVLLAQLLGTMNAVPGGFVNVLAAVLRDFMGVLKAIEDQKANA